MIPTGPKSCSPPLCCMTWGIGRSAIRSRTCHFRILHPHEEFAARFLVETTARLAGVLRKDWHVEPAEVLGRIERSGRFGPRAAHAFSPAFGADRHRQDGLPRPRQPARGGSIWPGILTRNRLIQSLLLNRAGNGLAISSKGKTAAELMVFARYVMFSEVYWHHAVRSATSMFALASLSCGSGSISNTFFRSSEPDAISAAAASGGRGRGASRSWQVSSGRSGACTNAWQNSASTRCPIFTDFLACRPCSYLMACAENLLGNSRICMGGTHRARRDY